MRTVLKVIALEILLVLALFGVASITDPNNHVWNGTSTFNGTVTLNGTVSGTHGQSVGVGDIVQFALLTLTNGLNITGGGFNSSSSGGVTPNTFNCNTSSVNTPCVQIANANTGGLSVYVPPGGGPAAFQAASMAGTFIYTGTGTMPTAGDVLCFYTPGGIGFPTSVGHAPVTAGAVGTCVP